MLPILATNRPDVTRGDLLRLAVLSVSLLALPLVRLRDSAVAEQPAPKPKEERILYWWKEGRLATIRPDGKDLKWVTEVDPARKYHLSPTCPCLSPDGRRVAYGMTDANAPPVYGFDRTERIFVKDLDEKGLGTDLGIDAHLWVWSPDGTKLAVTKWDAEAQKEKSK